MEPPREPGALHQLEVVRNRVVRVDRVEVPDGGDVANLVAGDAADHGEAVAVRDGRAGHQHRVGQEGT